MTDDHGEDDHGVSSSTDHVDDRIADDASDRMADAFAPLTDDPDHTGTVGSIDLNVDVNIPDGVDRRELAEAIAEDDAHRVGRLLDVDTGDECDGETVDSIVDKGVERAGSRPDTFRPVSVADRLTKRVRDDHPPNQALQYALRAAVRKDTDGTHSVDLIASHAPGNREKGEPRYHVRVVIRNEGMGHPVIGATVAGELVDRGHARITDVVECGDDHLVVTLRPVEYRVEPIDVPVDDIPDDFVRYSEVEHDAAFALRGAVNKFGVDDPKTQAAGYALGLALAPNDPERQDKPHGSVDDTRDRLLRAAGIDPEDREVTNLTPTEDGYLWEGAEDERVADAIAYGDVYPDTVFAPCGCGDYQVAFPSGDVPESFDVVCPECGNHFGQGPAPDEACPCAHDHDVDPAEREAVRETIRDWVEDNRHGFTVVGEMTVGEVADKITDAVFKAGTPTPGPVPFDVDGLIESLTALSREYDACEAGDFGATNAGEAFDRASSDIRVAIDDAIASPTYTGTTDSIQDFREDFDPAFEPGVLTDTGIAFDDFIPYSRRREGAVGVHVALQDKDTGKAITEQSGKAGEWNEVDTGREIYNVRVDVGADTPAAKPVTAYVCHGCGRKSLPEDFVIPSCSCDQEDGDACDECGGIAGPRCPRCGTGVDWERETDE